MTDRRLTLLDTATVAVVALLAILAVGVATAGPTGLMPMHFDIQGRPDRWGDRLELAGLLGFLALVAVATAGPMAIFARRAADPARQRGLRIGQAVSLVAIGGTAALVCSSILGHSGEVDAAPSMPGWTMALLGLIFAATGAVLGRVAPNPLVGVRTPWTFKSRLAWDRANRLAGRLFFWLGLLAIAAAPFAPQPTGMIGLVVAVVAASAWAVIESWRVWRTDPDRQPF